MDLRVIACLAAVIALDACPVRAASYSQSSGPLSLDYDESEDNSQETVFADFDSSLGTLTGVSFEVVGSASVRYSAIGLPNGSTMEFGSVIGLGGVQFGPERIGPTMMSFGVAAGGSVIAGTTSFDDTLSLPALSEFTEPGDEVDLTPLVTVYPSTYQETGLSVDLHDVITETFDYTPVPEPASIALMGVGLLGLGLWRLRRWLVGVCDIKSPTA